jgi:hypothetical protein
MVAGKADRDCRVGAMAHGTQINVQEGVGSVGSVGSVNGVDSADMAWTDQEKGRRKLVPVFGMELVLICPRAAPTFHRLDRRLQQVHRRNYMRQCQ